jgi:hypothetical protein
MDGRLQVAVLDYRVDRDSDISNQIMELQVKKSYELPL